MSILTTLGGGSGIDTAQLVSDLVAAQRAGADALLQSRQEKVDARISTLSQIKSALSSFSTALNALVSSGSLGRQTVSSDSATVAASASGTGEPTNISTTIEVQQLAQRQTVASASVADRNAPVGEGTLTISFGTVTGAFPTPGGFSPNGKSVTVTIGPDNNSLVGLQQAINASGSGLAASIIQDTGGARLVIKGETGAAQGFTIDGSAGLEAFEFGPGASGMTWSTQAANAVIVADGVAVERTTNSVSDLVPGVKLDLLRTNTGAPLTVTSDYDQQTLKDSVGNYVAAYNELMAMFAEATQPGINGAVAGPLAGDSTMRDLKRMLGGLTSKTLLAGDGPKSLAEIGVKTNRDGTLSIDDARLSAAVTQHPGRVHDMFVPGQTSNSPLLEVASAIGAAKIGSYEVTNVVAATAGTAVGSSVPNAFDMPVVIDASNKSFTATVDGRTSLTINLPEGSYASGDALASAFQSAINSDSVLASFGVGVTAGWDGSAFTFTSKSLGMASGVSLAGLNGTLAAVLGLDAMTLAAGTNASGTIAGAAAFGSGNVLTASYTSAAKGLAISVLGNVASATITVRDTISGMLADIEKQLTSTSGAFTTASARLSAEAKRIAEEQEALDLRSDALKERLVRQFTAMERAVSAFKATQSYMQQQIDMWTNAEN